MNIGVPRESKQDEYRLAIAPAGIDLLARAGHTVVVEKGSGEASGNSDEVLTAAGAVLAETHEEVFERAELIVKVKEPIPAEYGLFRRGQTLFTFLHLAGDKRQTDALMKSGILAIAYETVEVSDGVRPLLTPMSEIAGRLSVQEGAKYLERPQEGRGILLGGATGVPPANVLVLGGGIVGSYAARVASGLGALVTVMDINLARLQYLADIMPENVRTAASNPFSIRENLRTADLVIGGVLVTGARAPRLVSRQDLKLMKNRAVIVDVAIDQGGCFETSRPTTHRDPVYLVDGIVHYCVTNMPGAVPVTSTAAPTNATIPYLAKLANLGPERAVREDPALAKGVNIRSGELVYAAVRESFEGKP